MAAHRQCGQFLHVESLFGLSNNRIWRIDGARGQAIVKAAQSTEARFYQQVSPQLSTQGIHSPYLWHHANDRQLDWLVIEFIPQPLPRERWLADKEVVAQLRRLHLARINVAQDGWFRPQWAPAMTSAALNYLNSTASLRLHALQKEAQSLFEPRYWISADPNPMNWGIRTNGELVLFDWERFGRGTPTLDLAITVPGLGSYEDFARVAGLYADSAEKPFVRQLMLAKLWSVVEFLANVQAGQVRDATAVEHIAAHLPNWLENFD